MSDLNQHSNLQRLAIFINYKLKIQCIKSEVLHRAINVAVLVLEHKGVRICS